MKLPNLGIKPNLFWAAIAAATGGMALMFIGIFSGTGSNTGTAQRISFQIATGTTSGTYFPIGEIIAGVLSHPQGIGRCETADVCGPPGLIVDARGSEGSIANVRAVETGRVNSALAQADVVADAVAGKGAFARSRVKNLRLIAQLYPEAVHLVAANTAKIAGVADLRGRRVSLSTEGSGTIMTARAVLAAYGLSEARIRPSFESADRAVELMQQGNLDAFFFVGGTPVRLIDGLIERDIATLVPINGPGLQRLLHAQPKLSVYVIPEGTYHATPALETVGVGALWISNISQPENLIYAMTKALYNPINRNAVMAARLPQEAFTLDYAVSHPVAPFHAGAEKFFREAGVLAPVPNVVQ